VRSAFRPRTSAAAAPFPGWNRMTGSRPAAQAATAEDARMVRLCEAASPPRVSAPSARASRTKNSAGRTLLPAERQPRRVVSSDEDPPANLRGQPVQFLQRRLIGDRPTPRKKLELPLKRLYRMSRRRPSSLCPPRSRKPIPSEYTLGVHTRCRLAQHHDRGFPGTRRQDRRAPTRGSDEQFGGGSGR